MIVGVRASSYKINADIESMVWDPFCAFHLYCSLENGEIAIIDIRTPLIPLCTFQAHDKTTSGISFSSGVPGLFASSSIDKTVKLWDVQNIQKIQHNTPGDLGGKKISGVAVEGLEPHLVMYKTMNVGKLFCLQYYSDDPFVLATAGDKGSVAVWECDESEIVKNYFQDRVISGNDGTYSSLINNTDTTINTDTETSNITKNGTKNITKNVGNVQINSTDISVSAALDLPGHKISVEVPEIDESWMDEVDASAVKMEKKIKKSKNKDKDKVKKDKK